MTNQIVLHASARQVCDVLDATLRMPPGTARDAAKYLRLGGMLPSTRGIPTPLTWKEITALLVAVLLGRTCSPATPSRVETYSAMRASGGGPKFGEMLTAFLENPNDVFEVRIDANQPAATMTFRSADRGINSVVFSADSESTGPAFQSFISVRPEVFVRLSTAIKTATRMRTGRRSHSIFFKRNTQLETN